MMIHKITFAGQYSDTVYYLAFERNGVEFEPGDCINLVHPETDKIQMYSIASTPKNEKNIEVYFDITKDPTNLSYYFQKLRKGDIVSDGVFGTFHPGKNCTNGKYVYIANNTGISPFLSAIDTYSHKPKVFLVEADYELNIIEGYRFCSQYECYFATSKENTHFPKSLSAYYDKLPVDQSDIVYFMSGADSIIFPIKEYLINKGVSNEKIRINENIEFN